jgi:hypothetical protein
MRTKPKTAAALDGGATTARAMRTPAGAEPSVRRVTSQAPRTEFRKQMVIQLPIALINDLKRRALELSIESGRRVTQQQLVEEALRKHLYGR